MSKEKNDEKIKDLFIEASEESLRSLIKPSKKEDKKDDLIEKAVSVVQEGDSEWNLLAKDMDGRFAKRMRDELENLSGREFIRNYLKLAEYFKPKMTRQEEAVIEDEDNKLIIEVRHSSHNYEDNTIIDIPHESEDNKDNARDKS
jgi:hypothetical protein